MFKVYYKGELASEQEFATKKEAKNAIAPVLAGLNGKTVGEILAEKNENGERVFRVEGNYVKHYNPENAVARVCPICGKTFYVPSEKSLAKVCSDECREEFHKRYHSEYMKTRRKNDVEMAKRIAEKNLIANKRSLARKRWERRLAFADMIIKLSQMPNARETIATYLDKKVISQGAHGIDNRPYRSEEEIVAEKIFYDTMFEIVDSLGDLTESK